MPSRSGEPEREINEAFAAIAIAVAKDLGLPEDVVNVEGGPIAHGHPIGASGAVLMTGLLHSLQRDGIKRGVVTCASVADRASSSPSKRFSDPCS
jgi:acetyl-CoA C-acetyltransferase